ncbi:phage holin family protein [Paenibacillus sp. HWE-109]|uniref:phage holin family protein n=1 Tax=Paenibacillus sp. HWE-109 TaxID=1306526 RepID=UPI001EDEC480|nr:phage holin family protein [Paenibacillus sp. HWE-109]UKS30140.1 phage holin family protein [Paenibacillus sp. HWE-109]
MKQTLFNTAAGLFGAFISYAYGGWTDLLGFFLLAMAIDYVTGVAASIREGTGLKSEVGYWGLFRKILALLAILLAHRLDVVVGTDLIMTGAIYAFLANELLSITENYGRLGLPLPPVITNAIAVLKNRTGSGGDSK